MVDGVSFHRVVPRRISEHRRWGWRIEAVGTAGLASERHYDLVSRRHEPLRHLRERGLV